MLIVWTLGDDSISMGWIRFLRMAQDPNATSFHERNVLIVLLVALGVGFVAVPPMREMFLTDFWRQWGQNGLVFETPLLSVASSVDALI
ncbi:hypothetical protein ACLM45_12700 [Synechococcus sp. A10-1-5-9]|uniref:hypothetical protein n=1 Tax=Synechococcus sp. A10-1-5-9 TaxID=3392295 RepID=UPI0039EC612B